MTDVHPASRPAVDGATPPPRPEPAPAGDGGAGDGEQPAGRFASLASPSYNRLFWSGTLVFVAVQGSSLARAWLARSSNSALGGTLFAFGIAMLLASQFGGVLADRLSKRLIIIWANVVLFVSSFGLALAVQTGVIEYWMLVVSSAMQGMAFSFMGPARMAFTSELVPRRHLPNAVALGQLSLNATKVVGPAIAGAVIGFWSDGGTAAVYFASAAISIGAIAMTWPLPRTSATMVRRGSGSFRDGVAYVNAHRELRTVMLTAFVVVMVGYPYVIFLTRLVTDTFGLDAGSLGLLNMVQAIGAVVMSIHIANRMSTGAWSWQLHSGAVFGGALVLLAVVPNYALTIPVVLVLGATNAVFQTANNTLALTISEPEYHGRIQSLMMLSFSGFGIAALPLGFLADAIGLQPMFALTGLVVLGAIGWAVVWRWRQGTISAT